MIDYRDISRRLAAIGKNRQWLAKQLNLSTNTIRQYLGPKGKRTKELMDEIERVIVLEEARQREIRPDAPPWNLIFLTDEQFDRADQASRKRGYHSLKDFCREAILEKADQILLKSKRSIYRMSRPTDGQLPQVAEGEGP